MPDSAQKEPNRYSKIIERIFLKYYEEGAREVSFERKDIEKVAKELKIKLPKNLGDVIYSFRYRASLPKTIKSRAPKGENWIIRPAGRSRYCFVATKLTTISPSKNLAETKIPDSTPGVISMYSLSDEQALLAKLRYNRLVDIFSKVTCYSLQSHVRTATPRLGQVETDEIYIGVDRRGAHYVFPIQAKGGRDKLNVVQIEQDFEICSSKFPTLICRPIAAQFMDENLIALFEFEKNNDEVVISLEKHYRLVPSEKISPEDLKNYRIRNIDG